MGIFMSCSVSFGLLSLLEDLKNWTHREVGNRGRYIVAFGDDVIL